MKRICLENLIPAPMSTTRSSSININLNRYQFLLANHCDFSVETTLCLFTSKTQDLGRLCITIKNGKSIIEGKIDLENIFLDQATKL